MNTTTLQLARAQKLDLLSAWFTQHTKADVATKQLITLFGDIQESPMYETIWQLFDNYTLALRTLLGDMPNEPKYAWMHWFCYDNDMGARGLTAVIKGKLKEIKTLEDLMDLIEGDNHVS
jgi:hypothetical protein